MFTRQQIPNVLTLIRIAAVPACLAVILLAPELHGLLFILFGAAASTDFLDGHLARKWNVTSPIGALLDPIADKLIVILMLLYLMVHYGLSLLPVAAMILREVYLSGLREFLANKQIALPVSKGGKLKTSLQLTGILFMLGAAWLHIDSAAWLGNKLLWLAAIVSISSAIHYTKVSWPHLR